MLFNRIGDRPPAVDPEYEMDCRRVHIERVIEV
jgi:hypothetical protein